MTFAILKGLYSATRRISKISKDLHRKGTLLHFQTAVKYNFWEGKEINRNYMYIFLMKSDQKTKKHMQNFVAEYTVQRLLN